MATAITATNLSATAFFDLSERPNVTIAIMANTATTVGQLLKITPIALPIMLLRLPTAPDLTKLFCQSHLIVMSPVGTYAAPWTLMDCMSSIDLRRTSPLKMEIADTMAPFCWTAMPSERLFADTVRYQQCEPPLMRRPDAAQYEQRIVASCGRCVPLQEQ